MRPLRFKTELDDEDFARMAEEDVIPVADRRYMDPTRGALDEGLRIVYELEDDE